ncbi:hypothetical protein C8F01DRAFT_991960 [Mycena amicta]|nr:hypothetical protein C8F01DRAFT_991960 [Mycena amicta]
MACLYAGWPSWNPDGTNTWLSQAGHVFSSLNIRDNFDSYGMCVIHLSVHNQLNFAVIVAPAQVKVECSAQSIPTGYLFLCSAYRALANEDSKEGIAYWSLDPLGYKRLSREEARARGFPNLAITKEFDRYSWDVSVYEEIRALHIARGLDPDSQDIARSLGYPLFELVSDIEARERTGALR